MSAEILNGRELAAKILAKIASKINGTSFVAGLGIIQVGDDPATNIYIKNKLARAGEVGIKAYIQKLPQHATEKQVTGVIESFNSNPNITGFFIQSPLPPHLNLLKLSSLIDSKKDVDGMSPTSLGKLWQNQPDALVAATPLAVMALIKSIKGYELDGKNVVIIGRSTILGKPLAALMLSKNCTVTICHTKTQNLSEVCKSADILVTATGKSGLVTKDFVKIGAVVIDCGSPKPEVDFESVKEVAAYISPVPGGVGPVTIASLLNNLVEMASK